MLRIVLADDHRILRDGIRRGLEAAGEQVVGEASDGAEAVEVVRTTQPDVVLMDVSMPVLDGLEATRRITDESPSMRVVVLTMHDDPATTREAINAGAVGFLAKDSSMDEVIDTLRAAADGSTVLSPKLAGSVLDAVRSAGASPATDGAAGDGGADLPLLSERQVAILQGIADGGGTKQVARDLGISQKTVHNHLNAIYRRLETQSLTHAVLRAVRLGIIDLGPAAEARTAAPPEALSE